MFRKRKLLAFLFLISITYLDFCDSAFVQGKDGWTHELNLDEENGIIFRWRNSPFVSEESDRWIVMQVFARTKGYVGVGFSPNGGMAGADLVIGWVDANGSPHMRDYHALANAEPILDDQQDYELLKGREDENGTTIEFKRKWETCDSNDIDITNDTMRLIWAYSPFDPLLEKDIARRLQWHGTKTRGAKSVYLVDDLFATPFPKDDDPDVKHWDMLMDNNVVEAEHTTYFCKILKFPKMEKKHQMIGYRPILQPENKKNVHHLVFYECVVPPGYGKTEDVFEQHMNNSGGRCFTPNMPPEWTKFCVTFLFVWLSGSEGEMLPSHVGSPLGEEHGGATYFMLEMHYDNPELRTFKDSSGVRIYYTDKLRPNDGSVLLMGYRITPFLLLPPAQPKFVTYGVCSSECTKNAIPPEGINVIISLLHSHLSGRKMRLRHFRNGKELPIWAQDNHYDFNFQQSRKLQNEVKIMPGDELMLECEYETMENNRITLVLNKFLCQEMCQAFLMYYPRIDFMQCTSQYEFHDFFSGMGIKNVSGPGLKAMRMPYDPKLLPPEEQAFESADNAKELEESGDGASFKSVFNLVDIEKPEKLKGMSVSDYLKNVDWKKDEGKAFSKMMQNNWGNAKHYAYCMGHGGRRIPLKNHIISYPTITEPYEKPSSICEVQDNRRKSWSGTVIRYSEPDMNHVRRNKHDHENEDKVFQTSAASIKTFKQWSWLSLVLTVSILPKYFSLKILG